MKRIWTVLLAWALLLTACGPRGPTWQEQYDLGIKYLSEGSYEEAIIAFTAAIEIDPKQAPAYVGRGNAYIGLGETEENLAAAQADYEQAIELDKANADAYLGLADVYIRRGDYDKALEILRQGLGETGGDSSIASKIDEIESGNITDSFGNVRRMNTYDDNGKLIWYHIYEYDTQRRKSAVTSYDGTDNQTGHVDIMYNESGDPLIFYSYHLDTGEIRKMENSYDERGNRVKSIFFSPEGEMDGYYLYQYNSDGKLTRQDWFNNKGVLDSYIILEYDAAGNCIKSSDYSPDGTLRGYWLMEYDSEGNPTKNSRYGSQGIVSVQIFLYDDQGNNLGYEIYDADENITQSTINEG